MSERLHNPQGEQLQSVESSREQLEKLREEIEQRAEKQEKKDVGELSKKVEQHAISGREFSPSEHQGNHHHPVFANKELKGIAYSRTMLRVRKKLPRPARILSQTMHSKFIEKPSEIAEKTIARPSALLGGSLVAASGTSLLLWLTKRNGYQYSYLTVIILFIIGLVIGLGVEFGLRLVRRRR